MIRAGGCHCGAVRWEVELDPSSAEVIDCNCSICTKKGFLHLIVEQSEFRLVQGEDHITEYRFNTGTAVHKFCGVCGIHSFYVPRSHPDKISANAKCLDDWPDIDMPVVPFDGRNWEDNIDRIRD